MTLGEIRSEVARVVDNGVTANDPRVIQRVNQAQRRLHAIRSWLGLFAKYKVDVVNNIFTLPSVLENVHSVTKYTGSALPAGSVLLSEDANAFVHLDGDIVPLIFRPVSAAGTVTYQIDPSLGQNLTSVVVAGKKIFVPATSDSSTLLIDDLEALKLMVMALWREENNQLELASGLQAKAVEHLALKTDMAIEVARRLAYQTRLSSASPGTMAFVRSRLALDLNFGLKTDETQMFDLVNKAQDMLIDIKRTLLASGRYGVKDGLSLPSYSYIVSDSAQLPVPDYTTVKLAVLALMANSVNDKNPQLNPELAAKYEAEATKSLEQDLMVGLLAKTRTPDPVSSVTAVASCAEVATMVLLERLMVLLVRTSEPAMVASVPELGRVTLVLPVVVNVVVCAPLVVRFPPRVIVFPELLTPVPPY